MKLRKNLPNISAGPAEFFFCIGVAVGVIFTILTEIYLGILS